MPKKSYNVNYTTNTKKYVKIVDCGPCKGSGRDHTQSLVGVTCSACNGTGKVRV